MGFGKEMLYLRCLCLCWKPLTGRAWGRYIYIKGVTVRFGFDCVEFSQSSTVSQEYSHFGETVNVKKITVKKDGYKSQSQKPRKLKGWAYVNFVPWPMWNWIWGYFLDRSKSKCWKYKSDVFHFELEEK